MSEKLTERNAMGAYCLFCQSKSTKHMRFYLLGREIQPFFIRLSN